MKAPRSLKTLEKKAARARLLSITVLAAMDLFSFAFGIGFFLIGGMPLVGLALYLGLGIVLLYYIPGTARLHLPAPKFPLAEKVIYGVEALCDACTVYNDSLDYRKEKRRNSIVLQRQARYLMRRLRWYLSVDDPDLGSSDQSAPGPTNLLVGELSDFADNMVPVLKLIDGCAVTEKRVPKDVISDLSQVRHALQDNWTRVGDTHLAPLKHAAKVLQEAGATPDLTIGVGSRQLYMMRLHKWWLARSPIQRLVVLDVSVFLSFGLFLGFAAVLGYPFSLYQTSSLSLTLLGILVAIGLWMLR